MHRLRVKNFINLKDVDIEFKDVTLLIGPQSQGKSLISKLVFFFNSVGSTVLRSFDAHEDFETLKNRLRKKFSDYFHPVAWRGCDFEIQFDCGAYVFRLVNQGDGKDLSVEFPSIFDWWVENPEDDYGASASGMHELGSFFEQRYAFIPAGRSSLPIVQEFIFRLTTEDDCDLEPFIRTFASFHEGSRKHFLANWDVFRKTHPELGERFDHIVKGRYSFSSVDGDCIVSADGKNIPLSHCSSGQQESLPMMVILARIAMGFKPERVPDVFLAVEEPEAHLYPESQKAIVEFMSAVRNIKGSLRYLISTHSPYILTSFNNLATAGDVAGKLEASLKKGDISKDEFEDRRKRLAQVVPESMWLKPGDFTAYSVAGGTARQIMDAEFPHLVNASEIDDASNSISSEFDRIIELRPDSGE